MWITQGVYTDPDGLTYEQRKAKYDTEKCARCDKPYDRGNLRWKVPTFESYTSTYYLCPECSKEQMGIKMDIVLLEEKIRQVQKTRKDDTNQIYVEDGDYKSCYNFYSLRDFLDEIELYKKNEKEILADREFNVNLETKIRDLNVEISKLKKLYGRKV